MVSFLFSFFVSLFLSFPFVSLVLCLFFSSSFHSAFRPFIRIFLSLFVLPFFLSFFAFFLLSFFLFVSFRFFLFFLSVVPPIGAETQQDSRRSGISNIGRGTMHLDANTPFHFAYKPTHPYWRLVLSSNTSSFFFFLPIKQTNVNLPV